MSVYIYVHLHNIYDVAPDKSTQFPISAKLKTSNSTRGKNRSTIWRYACFIYRSLNTFNTVVVVLGCFFS